MNDYLLEYKDFKIACKSNGPSATIEEKEYEGALYPVKSEWNPIEIEMSCDDETIKLCAYDIFKSLSLRDNMGEWKFDNVRFINIMLGEWNDILYVKLTFRFSSAEYFNRFVE